MLFIVKMGGGGDVCTCDGWKSLPAKHTTTQASTHKSVASFPPSCHTSAHIPPILGASLRSVCMWSSTVLCIPSQLSLLTRCFLKKSRETCDCHAPRPGPITHHLARRTVILNPPVLATPFFLPSPSLSWCHYHIPCFTCNLPSLLYIGCHLLLYTYSLCCGMSCL